MASITNQVRVLELSKIVPLFNSPESPTEFSVPLTFFDILWLKFPPIECLFFYEITELTPTHFNSVIRPKLKHSLSRTLLHFLPLAGNITWQPDESIPMIRFGPNDGVSLTVAESELDLDVLSHNRVCNASLSRLCVPELLVEDRKAATMSLQITLFPSKGFCIGVTSHHAIADGKSASLFMKAWAHFCRGQETLPSELIPILDRETIHDPEGLAAKFVSWLGTGLNTLSPSTANLHNSLRAAISLSCEDIKKLREMVITDLNSNIRDQEVTDHIHLSRFVLAFAYTVVCIVKAKKLKPSTIVSIVFMADCRARLDPPVPENYFGNCITSRGVILEAEPLLSKGGVTCVVKKFNGLITSIEKGALEGIKERAERFLKRVKESNNTGFSIGVTGSTRFGAYNESDLGWGKPVKMEVTFIDRTGAVSMMDGRDGNGGVEIGLVLDQDEMERFDSFFYGGIAK